MADFTQDELNTLRALIHAARNKLDRIEAMITPPSDPHIQTEIANLDPANPLNRSGKVLTARGVEVCYRLYDLGQSRYEVAKLLKLSYAAANHRFRAWERFGGKNRVRQPLEGL